MSSKSFDTEFYSRFECVSVEKSAPILFTDPNSFWVLESGYIDIFLVPVDNKSEILGKGLKCFRYSVGDVIFGCNTFKINERERIALLGIPSSQVKTQKGSAKLFLSSDFDLTIVEKIDHWIESMDQCMSHYFSVPSKSYLIEAEPDTQYEKGIFLSTHYRDVVWVESESSSLLYGGKKELEILPHKPYPVTHWSSLQLEMDNTVSGYHTPTILLRDDFWNIFTNYSYFFMKIMSFSTALAMDNVKQSQRMYLKSDLYQKAKFRNLLDCSPKKRKNPSRTEGLIQICEKMFEDWGIEAPTDSELRVLENEKLKDTFHRLGFGVRELNLQSWNHKKINTGHIIGTKKNGVDCVGFFPPMEGKRKTYKYNDPSENIERDLRKQDIQDSSFFGLMIYPPLPNHVNSLTGLLKYSLKGQKNQFKSISIIIALNTLFFYTLSHPD